MSGFDGLVQKRFDGREDEARKYVGRLGAASYFRYTRPGYALAQLLPYRDIIPELFVYEKNEIVGIAWQSRRMKARSKRRGRELKRNGVINA